MNDAFVLTIYLVLWLNLRENNNIEESLKILFQFTVLSVSFLLLSLPFFGFLFFVFWQKIFLTPFHRSTIIIFNKWVCVPKSEYLSSSRVKTRVMFNVALFLLDDMKMGSGWLLIF